MLKGSDSVLQKHMEYIHIFIPYSKVVQVSWLGGGLLQAAQATNRAKGKMFKLISSADIGL